MNAQHALIVCFLAAAVLTSAPGTAAAQTAVEIPTGYRAETRPHPGTYRFGYGNNGSSQVLPVRGPGFDLAVEITCNRRGMNGWDANVSQTLPWLVAKGDAVLLIFYARTIRTENESGQGIITAESNKVGGQWFERSLTATRTVGSDWQEFVIPFEAKDGYPPQGMTLSFWAGADAQILQIGGVRLLNYGKERSADDLPRTIITYEGRGADAPWRAEAAARIREHRMAPYTVRVVDADGRPVPDAEVHVRLQRHAYEFGYAVRASAIADEADPKKAVLRKKVAGLFNAGTFYNALKWPAWEGDWGSGFRHETVMKALRWTKDNDIAFRGHVLVWPSWRHLPRAMRERFQDAENPDSAAIQAEVLKHIDTMTTATKGYVSEWDVINEPYHNHDLMDICGRHVMVEWFERARRNLPDAGLAVNEFGQIVALADTPHQAHFEETLRYLLEQNARITVIGVQGHFGGTVPSPTRVLAVLDRLAKFGLPIRVTEFTVGGEDEALRADFTRDCLTAVFSHESTIGFQIWDSLFTDDMEEKANCRAYRDLVLGEW